MDHRLIIFAGSSSGAGKSTLSSFLYKQLQLNGINARWLYEDDVQQLPLFAEVNRAFKAFERNVTETLLEATVNFVEECLHSDEIYVTDSIFPFFSWLFAYNFSFETLEDFNKRLQPLLEKLNPLLIYLDCDIPLAYERALLNRGEKYGINSIKYLGEWLYFKENGIKVQSLAEIIEFFEKMNETNLKLLADWNLPKLILNTTSTSLPGLKQAIIHQLGINEITEPTPPDREVLQKFVGTYVGKRVGDIPETLEISFKGNDFWVDTYWPDGCPLVKVENFEGKFQLKSTNQFIVFDISPTGQVTGLTLLIVAKEYPYVKTV